MNALQQFHALHGATVSKQEIERIIALAKQENNTEVIFRLSQVLQNFEQDKHPIEIVDYPTSLNAPRHTGSYKEALDNCGRLRPGYKFENGNVVRVLNKSVKHPTKRITKHSKKETILNSSDEVLNGIEFIENDTHLKGLNKAVSPNEIYDTVTNLIINTIKKVGHLPWQKEWIGSGSNMEARNYVTKKSYSGINHLFLNFDVIPDPNNPGYSLLVPIKFIEPYYLTFNQIKEAKATLKKGSKAHQVFYYTMIYDFKKDNLIFKSSDVAKWKNFISENNLSSDDLKFYLSKIPVLKYYNVYRADDCTGLKFPAKPAPKTTTPIEQAQEIIDNYPNPPKYTVIGSDAYYTPPTDTVNMPLISAFTKEAFYYSTYFHEIVHSTGHSKRLNRGNDTRKRDGSKEDKKAYAFEELVAELGAVFLCSESGILFTTVENSAKYLKGWNSRLVTELQNDNRFFMKAAAKSQQAVDYILDKQNSEKNVQTPTKATDKIVKSTAKSKKTTKTVVENVPKVKNQITDNISPKIDQKTKQISLFGASKKYPLSIVKKDLPLGTRIKLHPNVIGRNKKGTIVGHTYAERITNVEYPFEVMILFDNETEPEQIKPYVFDIIKDKKTKLPTKKPLKGFDIVGNTIGNIIANSLLQPEAPKNSLANRLANKSNQPREYYNIPNKDIANFLGKIEKKTKESVAITIAGGQGSMKTRLCFQLMNCFAQNYKVGHASIEEHPESALYEDKIHQYLNKKALHNISAPEISTIQDVYNLVKENDVIVIDSFSKLQEMQKGCELDKDFRKAYDGKLFIIIYQQTTDGKMRGGSKSQFDGDVICFVKKEPNYQDNYCYMDKNRYQKKNLEDLKFNIYSGKLIGQENENIEPTPTLKQPNHQFNFKIE